MHTAHRTAAFLVLYSSAVFLALAAAPATTQTEGTCVSDAVTLCLSSGRFSVEVDWDDTVNAGQGQVHSFGTENTGFFYYQDARYLDLMIRVLDGCGVNAQFWVFSVGLSDAIQTVTVTDTVLESVWIYDNALGDFPTLTDTNAMPCNPPSSDLFAESPSGRTNRESLETEMVRGSPTTTLSLLEGRFQVKVDWKSFEGSTGAATPEPITDHSGVFWFFNSAHYELLLKIVDASSIDGFYWLFFGATTDIEYTVLVTDICTGATQSYTNPLGSPVSTTVDTTSFGAAGTCDIFADGFESGDTTHWTLTAP